MRKNLLIIIFIFFGTFSKSQTSCDTTKISKKKLIICEVEGIVNINIDSLANSFNGKKNEIHYVVVPKDSLIRQNSIILSSNKSFFGDRVAIQNLIIKNKRSRVIINMNEDLSTELVSYKDSIRNGGYSKYYFPYLYEKVGKYKDNLKKGKWIYWDSVGRLTKISYYKNGEVVKSFEGKRLKSLKIIKIGFLLEAGNQHINCGGINSILRVYSTTTRSFDPGSILLKYGMQIGNPLSLTLQVFHKQLINKTVTDFLLSGQSYGFSLHYNLLRSKNFNFIFGSGLELPSFDFYRSVNRNPPFTDEVLSNSFIKNKRGSAIDFNLTISPRRLRFKRKTNLDYHNYLGVQLGYTIPNNKGKYFDRDGVNLNLSQSLFYLNGIHISIFFSPFNL